MTGSRKVLIIDDEIDLCLLLKNYFLRKNYEVFITHSMSEGLSLLKDIQPSLVFIDNNLPDQQGWENAPDIAHSHPGIYIVLTSAFHPTPPQMPEKSYYKIIEKPIRIADLDKQMEDISILT
jgi:DNA-binding NtrC family response regulator